MLFHPSRPCRDAGLSARTLRRRRGVYLRRAALSPRPVAGRGVLRFGRGADKQRGTPSRRNARRAPRSRTACSATTSCQRPWKGARDGGGLFLVHVRRAGRRGCVVVGVCAQCYRGAALPTQGVPTSHIGQAGRLSAVYSMTPWLVLWFDMGARLNRLGCRGRGARARRDWLPCTRGCGSQGRPCSDPARGAPSVARTLPVHLFKLFRGCGPPSSATPPSPATAVA